MKYSVRITFFLALCMITFSCTKQGIDDNKTSNNMLDQESTISAKKIKVKQVNKLLVFQNKVDMIRYRQAKKIEKVSNNNITSRDANLDGFVSMGEAYTTVIDEQASYAEYLEQLETTSPGSVSESEFNSISTQVLLDYPNAYVEVTFLDGTKYLDINCDDLSMALIINQDGFVQIGDTLMQYSSDTLKYMVGGTPYDTEILDQAQTSVPQEGIYVQPIAYQEFTAKLLGWGTFNSVRKSCQSTNGRSRILGYYDFINYTDWQSNPRKYNPEHRVRVLALRKRLFGLWWDAAGSGGDVGISWNVIGNSSSGFFRTLTSGDVSGFVQWSAAGNNGQSFNGEMIKYLSYNPKTQGEFITSYLPIVYQANISFSGSVYKSNGVPLGNVSCGCTYNR